MILFADCGRGKKEDKVIELDETKLVDAVVWSEILGPPRAKKPYRKIR